VSDLFRSCYRNKSYLLLSRRIIPIFRIQHITIFYQNPHWSIPISISQKIRNVLNDPKTSRPNPLSISQISIPKPQRKKNLPPAPIESTSPTPVDPIHTTPNPSLAYTSTPLFHLHSPNRKRRSQQYPRGQGPFMHIASRTQKI
jgi:hypothetical protein